MAGAASNFWFIAYSDDKRSLLLGIWIGGACCIALGIVVLNLFIVGYFWLILIGFSFIVLAFTGYSELYRHFKPRGHSLKGIPNNSFFSYFTFCVVMGLITYYLQNRPILAAIYGFSVVPAYLLYVPVLKYLYKKDLYKKPVPYIASICAVAASVLAILFMYINDDTFFIPFGIHVSVSLTPLFFYIYRKMFKEYPPKKSE
jgi:hypothetical protein